MVSACKLCKAHYQDDGRCDEGKPLASPHRHSKSTALDRCGNCGKGVLWVVTQSRLEDALGHTSYRCDRCGARSKRVPMVSLDAERWPAPKLPSRIDSRIKGVNVLAVRNVYRGMGTPRSEYARTVAEWAPRVTP